MNVLRCSVQVMIYLDHAATTPPSPKVLEIMLPHMQDNWGNPSSPHAKGQQAKVAIDTARSKIADLAGFQPHEVVFVSSGSEGNTLAMFGIAKQWLKKNQEPGHIILSSIEHSCSLKAADKLREQGWKITALPVDTTGMVQLADLEACLQRNTTLVSIHVANNEVGTLQPVEDIYRLCQERDVPFHCDAVQGIGLIPLPQADILTIAAHKFYGPKGVGALLVRDHIQLEPLILGGGQEFGMRAGTEYTAGIVGMSAALEFAIQDVPNTPHKIQKLRDAFEKQVLALGDIRVNGHLELRLPNFSNMQFIGKNAESLLVQLDMHGICASSGAACASGAIEKSHVLQAMGQADKDSKQNIRFSLGKDTTEEDIANTVVCLRNIL